MTALRRVWRRGSTPKYAPPVYWPAPFVPRGCGRRGQERIERLADVDKRDVITKLRPEISFFLLNKAGLPPYRRA
jgi:hypothetical protein